jgi:predicted Zn-dependent protease
MVQNGSMRSWAVPFAFGCVGLCYAAQDRLQNPAINYASGKEAALGAQLAAQVRRNTSPLGLGSVDNYVAALGHELAAQMPNAPEAWKFSVIKDHERGSIYEPLSLPGG